MESPWLRNCGVQKRQVRTSCNIPAGSIRSLLALKVDHANPAFHAHHAHTLRLPHRPHSPCTAHILCRPPPSTHHATHTNHAHCPHLKFRKKSASLRGGTFHKPERNRQSLCNHADTSFTTNTAISFFDHPRLPRNSFGILNAIGTQVWSHSCLFGKSWKRKRKGNGTIALLKCWREPHYAVCVHGTCRADFQASTFLAGAI